jgi:hypothetical protein
MTTGTGRGKSLGSLCGARILFPARSLLWRYLQLGEKSIGGTTNYQRRRQCAQEFWI